VNTNPRTAAPQPAGNPFSRADARHGHGEEPARWHGGGRGRGLLIASGGDNASLIAGGKFKLRTDAGEQVHIVQSITHRAEDEVRARRRRDGCHPRNSFCFPNGAVAAADGHRAPAHGGPAHTGKVLRCR
jgi:hypothetical protein